MAGPEHVGSGSFRVDRARALATLATRRFRDPSIFIDCWLRCAEAAGAGKVELEPGRGCTITLGAALPSIGGDPWAPVFDPSPRTAAAHELAMGALACLASKPKELTIESGGFRLELDSLETARWVPRPKGGRDSTTMRVIWRGAEPDWRSRLKRERFWFARTSFGADASPPSGLGVEAQAERGRVRLRLLPRSHEAHRSVIHLYRLGVFVETIEADLPARAWIQANDDAAELSLDLQRFAPGSRRDRLLELALARLEGLVKAVVARHEALFAAAASRLKDSGQVELWASRHGRSPSGEELATAFSRLSPYGDRHLLIAAGWLADWLHASNVQRLERVPLFFAGGGKTTTLEALQQEREREGVVRWSRRDGAAPVWCPSTGELAWLTRHFGGALREE